MPYIFLDESGSLTNDGNYFVMATFSVGNPKRITRAFRRFQHNKFPKKLKHQSEIKFNDPSLDNKLRLKTLKFLAQQDIRIFYTYLKVANIPEEYMRKNKVHETGLLYLEIVGSTLELYLPITDLEFRVFRDQRTTKGMKTSEFNEKLRLRLLPNMPAKTLLQIESLDSTTSVPVQVVDWVCGGLAAYHEGKANGQDFYNILRPNIVEKKELFSNL